MLRGYRNRIDEIDLKLVELLKERFAISSEIGRTKQLNCLDVYDPGRETDKFNKYLAQIGDDNAGQYIFTVLSKIMEASKQYQEDQKYEFGILGRKLTHTYSPEVHMMLGGYKFGIFEREPEQLESFIKDGEFKGLCVTMPYKKTVMEYCSELSDSAEQCGSVNVLLKRADGSLYGDNTDYFGLRYLLASAKMDVRDSKCLVLGNGGVAATVRQVLSDSFAREIVTISRSGENNYENIYQHKDADYIINATPVGMYPDNGKSPLDIEIFDDLKGVVDLIYNPVRTRLVLDAQRNGIPAVGGLQMLVSQAAPAVESFTGQNVPYEKIADVCEKLEQKIENVILIGMPGCGKTSIGQVLSRITGKPFADSDDVIEEENDMLCEQIILADGEKVFREIEKDVIKRKCAEGGQILALGGGAVESPELFDIVRENGRVVYIRRDLRELPMAGRPISQEKGVWEIFEERGNKYIEWSDLQVDNEGIEDTAIMIAALLGYFKKGDDAK